MSGESEPVLTPSQPASATHEVIVVLESIHVPWEPVDLSPRTYEALVYKNTVAGVDDVVARIRDASIIVCTICKLTGELLRQAPKLKCILGHPVGTDHVDLEYCRQNGIQVMNCRDCNSESVAEHAIALYFATRRSLVTIHNTIMDFAPGRPNEWKTKGTMGARMRDATGAPPRTCSQEVAGIVGYGAVGKHIHRLCTALGMKRVLIAERTGTTPTTTAAPPGRTPLRELLASASVVFLALPLLPATANLISGPELRLMPPHAVLVNVSRGGIVDEAAVVAAAAAGEKKGIFGYGTDVFAVEPAGSDADSCLLGSAAPGGGRAVENLVLTGHLAWLSETTVVNQVRRVAENLRAWVDGDEGRGDFVVGWQRGT